jgi:hypothetical protein
MVTQHPEAMRRMLNQVNYPGSIARHFRVQFQETPAQDWHMYATFATRDNAEKCLTRLSSEGIQARMVVYPLCSTAV